ncbi:Ribonucleases P/MRP protein subunit pop1 [Dimargaris verticillata]|uniref:Ribonucleases P/MRP protein subunit pop1 n=1 Tax=Dimargaris verticillata TaxID=2761393 RepID=A0A9W8E7Q2_9FUNG|nr:Ribonucleases P/MRP protein subunit pop1 [Dimargaris verticillata]
MESQAMKPVGSKGSGPTAIEPLTFLNERAAEVQALHKAVSNADMTSKARAFQTLPRHLRRRQASHNPNRMPMRLRKRAEWEMKQSGGVAKKPAKQSRYWRRRPGRIADEFKRRQQSKRWLETHIWHAKRMKMTKRWNCMVAEHSNERNIRANYRAAKHLVLATDMSYHAFIELSGSESVLASILVAMADPTAPAVTSAHFLHGHHQCTTVLYHPGQYPHGCIGPVTLLWCPVDILDSVQPNASMPLARKLWLIVHPGAFEELMSVLEQTVQSLAETNPHLASAPFCQVTDLTGQLNLFEFTGPHTVGLLEAIFTLASAPDEYSERTATVAQLWQGITALRSTASLPAGAVLGLNIQDPRLTFPHKVSVEHITQRQAELGTATISPSWMTRWPRSVALSPLWDPQVRQALATNKAPEHALNQRRQDNLIPGTKLAFTANDAVLPVLLFQRRTPGVTLDTTFKEFTDGWSLIVPGGWGNDLWKCFAFAGARMGGQRDLRSHYFEAGLTQYPFDFAGTHGFVVEQLETKQSLQSAYEKKPPAKRPNYKKQGLATPFEAPLASLISNGPEQSPVASGDTMSVDAPEPSAGDAAPLVSPVGPFNEYFVVRGQPLVQLVQKACQRRTKVETTATPVELLNQLRQRLLVCIKVSLEQHVTVSPSTAEPANTPPCYQLGPTLAHIEARLDLSRALVRVKLTCVFRGTPEANCAIYEAPEEIFFYQQTRVQSAKAQQSWLESQQLTPASAITSGVGPTVSRPRNELNLSLLATIDLMSELKSYQCADVKGFDHDQLVIGYTVAGRYSLHHGKGIGMGYCSLARIVTLAQKGHRSGARLFVMLRRPMAEDLYPAWLELAP